MQIVLLTASNENAGYQRRFPCPKLEGNCPLPVMASRDVFRRALKQLSLNLAVFLLSEHVTFFVIIGNPAI